MDVQNFSLGEFLSNYTWQMLKVSSSLAFQALLSEAYLTSPLDDGYVVVTPRH